MKTKKILRRILLGVLVLLVCYAAVQDRMGLPVLFPSWQEVSDSSAKVLSGPYKVLYVTDGDTLRLNINGTDTFVRLIGIDAPESASHDESQNTKEGEESAAFLKNYLEGKRVGLEFDELKEDKYGRTLAYVWLDGELVNKKILDEGFAEVLDIPPNEKYVDYLKKPSS